MCLVKCLFLHSSFDMADESVDISCLSLTGFPSSSSEYASLAAQTVIGQVLDGVAPLSDDARVQALSITIAAFMEAWMEHILKHRIKFRWVLHGIFTV